MKWEKIQGWLEGFRRLRADQREAPLSPWPSAPPGPPHRLSAPLHRPSAPPHRPSAPPSTGLVHPSGVIPPMEKSHNPIISELDKIFANNELILEI